MGEGVPAEVDRFELRLKTPEAVERLLHLREGGLDGHASRRFDLGRRLDRRDRLFLRAAGQDRGHLDRDGRPRARFGRLPEQLACDPQEPAVDQAEMLDDLRDGPPVLYRAQAPAVRWNRREKGDQSFVRRLVGRENVGDALKCHAEIDSLG